MSKLLTQGIHPLAYMGVNPIRPVNMWQYPRSPTTNDWMQYELMDHWENIKPTDPDFKSVWILVLKTNRTGIWVKFISGGFGPIIGLQPDEGAVVNAINGIVNVHNPPIAIDGNIRTQNGTINGDPLNYLDLRLTDTINITNNGIFGLRNNSGGAVVVYQPNNVVNQFNLTVATFNGGVNSSGLNIVKARGTPNVPTAIVTGDELGIVAFEGFVSGANQVIGASIRSVSSGTIAVNRVAANLIFATHPDSVTSVTPIDRMTINSAGQVTIAAPDSGGALTVNSNGGGTAALFNGNIFLAAGFNGAALNGGWSAADIDVNAVGPEFILSKSRAGAIVQNADILGEVNFEGKTLVGANNGFTVGVQLQAIVSGVPTSGTDQLPTTFNILTRNAAGALGQRFSINDFGNTTISAADAGTALTIGGTYNTAVGATQALMVIDNTGKVGTAGSGATFVDWTAWTPTLFGATVAGVTTYSIQQGYYTRIGNTVTAQFRINCSAATGTGNLSIGGLPFTVNNATNYDPVGVVDVSNLGGTLVWGAGYTMTTLRGRPNTTEMRIILSGSGVVETILQMANTDIQVVGTLIYRV